MSADPLLDARKEAVKLAHDSTKQILTLSSAVIAALVSVLLVSKVVHHGAAGIAVGAAFALFISNVFGLLALFGLAGILEEGRHIPDANPRPRVLVARPGQQEVEDPTLMDAQYAAGNADRVLMSSHYKTFGRLQFLMFGFGTLLLFVSICVSLSLPPPA